MRKAPDSYHSRYLRTLVRVEHWFGYRQHGCSLGDCQVLDASVEGWENLSGLTLNEIARLWKTSYSGAIIRLSDASKGQANILIHDFAGSPDHEEPLEAILSHVLCLFGTDVLIRDSAYPNPGALGSFPRILGLYVRGKQLFSLENAIKRMTSDSAARFGLKDRGILAEGKAADIVVFDPQTISDVPPQGGQPAQRPRGVHHVFLNGVHVVKDGIYFCEKRAGKVLKV